MGKKWVTGAKWDISILMNNIAESTIVIFLSLSQYFLLKLSVYAHISRTKQKQNRVKVEAVRYGKC